MNGGLNPLTIFNKDRGVSKKLVVAFVLQITMAGDGKR